MSSASFDFNALAPEIEVRVEALLAQMTLEEKVGQLFKPTSAGAMISMIGFARGMWVRCSA